MSPLVLVWPLAPSPTLLSLVRAMPPKETAGPHLVLPAFSGMTFTLPWKMLKPLVHSGLRLAELPAEWPLARVAELDALGHAFGD